MRAIVQASLVCQRVKEDKGCEVTVGVSHGKLPSQKTKHQKVYLRLCPFVTLIPGQLGVSVDSDESQSADMRRTTLIYADSDMSQLVNDASSLFSGSPSAVNASDYVLVASPQKITFKTKVN